MPATKGRPGGAEPEDLGEGQVETTSAGLTAEEKRARGQQTRAKAAAKEAAREERLAQAEQKRAQGRADAKEEAQASVRRPVLEGSAEDERRRAADEKRARKELGIAQPSPRWWAPVMVTLMVLGLLWVVFYYASQGALPIASIGAWNIGIGFALMLVGFGMTTVWR